MHPISPRSPAVSVERLQAFPEGTTFMTYLTIKELNAMFSLSRIHVNCFLRQDDTGRKTSSLPFISHILKSRNPWPMNYLEYRICNAGVKPLGLYTVLSSGGRAKVTEKMDPKTYADYKVQKLHREMRSVFSTITYLDWRRGCREGRGPQTYTFPCVKDQMILLDWRALKGIQKFPQIKKLMLTCQGRDYVFSGNELATLKNIASKACTEHRHKKLQAMTTKIELEQRRLMNHIFASVSHLACTANSKLHELSTELLENLSSYLTMKEVSILYRASPTFASALLKTDAKQEKSALPFICHTLQSLTFLEYRICNTKINPVIYRFDKAGNKVTATGNLNPQVYAMYKMQKLSEERKKLLFSTITHLDWRAACCKEDKNMKTLLSERGKVTLYWKAWKGILKFQNLSTLKLTSYPQSTSATGKAINGPAEDHVFSGTELASLIEVISKACNKNGENKIKAKRERNLLEQKMRELDIPVPNFPF